ncbi:MAG TPA: hypothetical protein DEG28_13245 [Porphyromonadaceae bacterium]|jgi:hypothetical protein|nr:hypothetical protein [Porphyromonadaceae bacterium]
MSSWPRENNNERMAKLALFIISPFIAFLYSLKNMKSKSSYIVFFLSSILFGLSFTVPSGKTAENMSDGASYRLNFELYRNINYSEFIEGFKEYITFKDGSVKDYYFDTIAFITSRFTDNYHVLFMFFAIIFAFFSLKSFKFLTQEYNFSFSLASFILAYLFMINQIFNINGMRFWTAAWVGVYAVFQIFKNGNHRYYWLAVTTPFIHASFWVYIGILIIASIFKRYEKFWGVLFVVSFFISTISIELVRNIGNLLPPFLEDMVQSYTNEEYIIQKEQEKGFISLFFSYAVIIYINVLVLLFIRNAKAIKDNNKSKSLYLFLLVYMTFVNFSMPIPSLGGRFIILSYPIIAYIWLTNFKDRKYQKILYVMPFVFLFQFYMQFNLYKLVTEPYFYFTSPFYLIYRYLF